MYANTTIVHYQIRRQKRRCLKSWRGRKARSLAALAGVADDGKRMEFYGVVVGQCENLVVEEGGILVVDTDRLQLGACTKVLSARACTKVLRIAWIVDGINLVASSIIEESNFHRSCCLFYRDLVIKIYSDTICTVCMIKMSQIRHTF